MTDTKEHKMDVAGKKIGRVASGIAHVLLGKDSTNFARNTVANVRVVVENVDNLDIPESKRMNKVYDRYSGFHGGRKEETLEELITKKGNAEVLRKAVLNMLPKNRLRKERMKNLVIK